MKCIILLTLVALCYSYPYSWGYGRNIGVNPDGSIHIASADGRRFIYKGTEPYSAGYGSGFQSYRYPEHQTDALYQLLQKYQGDIGQGDYQQLLEEVRGAVQAGQVRGDVYETLQGLEGRGFYGPSQLWQLLQYGQQLGRYQQYPGAYVYSPQYGSYLRGSSYQYSPFFSKLFGRQGYGYGEYGQPGTGQLYQVIQGERQILGQQDQIRQGQIHQQLQQQQLSQQQYQQQKEQYQQQKQQQYLQELQEDVQQEQQQVLGEQERLQQYQPQGYGGYRNWLSGGRWGQSQQPYFGQQYYGVYPLGRSYGGYGGYGQGYYRPSTSWVF